jgi:hypothetical protein
MPVTRPVRIAYRPRAFASCVSEAPGKFVVLNSAKAGSVLLIPKSIRGTRLWFWSQTSAWVNSTPKLRLCAPRTQLRLSWATLVDASRELRFCGFPAAPPSVPMPPDGFMRSWPVPQHAPLMLRCRPPWFATEPLKRSGVISVENSVAPPVAPKKRRSFTRFAVNADRSEPWYAKRFESCTPWIGKPGKATSRLLRVSGSERSLLSV